MNRVTLFCSAVIFTAFEALADGNSNFEVFANLDSGPGNVTATVNGRIIMSQHQFYQPQYTVVEYKDQNLLPFPNKEMSAADSTAPIKLDSVLGIRSDSNGIVWMLDNGMRSGGTPKLVGWNTKTNKLQRLIYLPAPIAPKDAFVNDFALDTHHNHAFISDPAGGANAALIVVNLSTGAARRVLEGHQSVIPEKRRFSHRQCTDSGENAVGRIGETAYWRESHYRGFGQRMGLFRTDARPQSLPD